MSTQQSARHSRLGRVDVIALVLGSVIGWGSFTLPGTRFLSRSGVLDSVVGFAIGALMVALIQRGYHVMLEHHGRDGGEFTYVHENLGRLHGFIVGWSLVLCYISLVGLNGIAAVLVFKRIFGDDAAFGLLYSAAGFPVFVSDILIASAVMAVFAWINIRGIRGSARAQNALVLSLLANVLVLSIVMFSVVDLGPFTTTYISGWTLDWGRVASVVAIVPFLFVGFDVIPQVAQDLDFAPGRATKLALVGVLAGAAIYSLLNAMTGLVFSPEEARQSTWATGEAIQRALGPVGLAMLVLALTGAVLGGINAFTLASSKLIAALAFLRFLPSGLGERCHSGTFRNAILMVLGISLIAPWVGREVINYIVDMCSLLAAIAYVYTCGISVWLSQGLARIGSVLGMCSALTFIALMLVPGSPGALSGPALFALGVWVVAGGAFYLVWGRHASARP